MLSLTPMTNTTKGLSAIKLIVYIDRADEFTRIELYVSFPPLQQSADALIIQSSSVKDIKV